MYSADSWTNDDRNESPDDDRINQHSHAAALDLLRERLQSKRRRGDWLGDGDVSSKVKRSSEDASKWEQGYWNEENRKRTSTRAHSTDRSDERRPSFAKKGNDDSEHPRAIPPPSYRRDDSNENHHQHYGRSAKREGPRYEQQFSATQQRSSRKYRTQHRSERSWSRRSGSMSSVDESRHSRSRYSNNNNNNNNRKSHYHGNESEGKLVSLPSNNKDEGHAGQVNSELQPPSHSTRTCDVNMQQPNINGNGDELIKSDLYDLDRTVKTENTGGATNSEEQIEFPLLVGEKKEKETKKKKSGWSAAPTASGTSSGFAVGPNIDKSNEAMKNQVAALGTVVAGDAALQTSRLHLLAQQMGFSPEQIKAARELYVGNLPPHLEVNQLVEFLNAALLALGANVLPGAPGVKGWRASDGHFAFVEFRTMEEANNGLALNSINCLGYNLRIGRPKTYPDHLLAIQAAQEGTLPSNAGVTNGILTGIQSSLLTPQTRQLLGAAVCDSSSFQQQSQPLLSTVASAAPSGLLVQQHTPSDRLCMLNLPPVDFLPESKLKELLSSFGTLKYVISIPLAMNSLEKYDLRRHGDRHSSNNNNNPPSQAGGSYDEESGSSVCFFQFEQLCDQIDFKDAIEDLILFKGQRVILRKSDEILAADQNIRSATVSFIRERISPKIKEMYKKIEVPTRCLYFANILHSHELMNEAEYSDIIEDIRLECKEHGRVISIEIPKPKDYTPTDAAMIKSELGGSSENPNPINFGKPTNSAFVEFATVEECMDARHVLSTYKFAGRKVRVHFFSEKRYLEKEFDRPEPNCIPMESSLITPSLAAQVPAMLKQLEDIEKVNREMMRAAATAAANASFVGGGMVGSMGMLAIADSQAAALSKIGEQEMIQEEEEMDMD